MLYLFIGLIYIICIASTDAIYVNDQTFAKMDMVNENNAMLVFVRGAP